MQTGHELFIHELSDILDGERQLVDALQELESDSINPQLKKAFANHREETQGHVERLQECFSLLGEQPQEMQCAGIKGLIEEKKTFMEEGPSEDIVDVFDVGAGIKSETYEICTYELLIRLAREMKHNKVVQLLGQILKEEQAALKKLEGFSKEDKTGRDDDRGAARARRRSFADEGKTSSLTIGHSQSRLSTMRQPIGVTRPFYAEPWRLSFSLQRVR